MSISNQLFVMVFFGSLAEFTSTLYRPRMETPRIFLSEVAVGLCIEVYSAVGKKNYFPSFKNTEIHYICS